MSSLAFLLIKSIKNSLFELLHKPGKLVLWLAIIAMIVGIFVLSTSTRQSTGSIQDIVWLKGILFLLILFFVVMAIQKGLANGDTIFDMSDVNLLFVSPVNPRLILMYGIVRMAKIAFLAGFFILFQSNTLSNVFGVGFNAVLLVLLGFILAVCLLQIISLLVYSLSNGKPARKMAVRFIAAAVFLPLIIYICIQLVQTNAPLAAVENTLHSSIINWTPVVGWAAEGTVALISGNMGNGFLFLGLIILSGALLILYIALSNPDYYEDVLVATETSFEKKRSVAEGQINTDATSMKKVKVSKTGITGSGASTIFYKHLRESFRANKLGLWGTSSIIIIFGAALVARFMSGESGGLLMILQILMWMQIFYIGTGRGLKEVYMHYIYLIPESSFRKIVWSNLELAFKVLVESMAIFFITGYILGEPLPLIILAIAVYTLFSFLLLGINYLSLRWTGADLSAGLLTFIYTIAVIVIMLPGLITAIFVGRMYGGIGVLIGLGILAIWELIAALVCFALSKGILHNCDMPVFRPGSQR